MGCLESRDEQKAQDNDPTKPAGYEQQATTGAAGTQDVQSPGSSSASPRAGRKSQQWVPKGSSQSGGATGETANVSLPNSDKDEFAASGATGDAKGEASPPKENTIMSSDTLNKSKDSGIGNKESKLSADEKQAEGLNSPRDGGASKGKKNKKKNQNQNQNQDQVAQQQQASGGQSGRSGRKKTTGA